MTAGHVSVLVRGRKATGWLASGRGRKATWWLAACTVTRLYSTYAPCGKGGGMGVGFNFPPPPSLLHWHFNPYDTLTLTLYKYKTFNNGSLGSCNDEERSEMRKVMRFA